MIKEDYWQIYPENCNPVQLGNTFMAHGGALLTRADRVAAILSKHLLKGQNLHPLTVGVDKVQFYRGPACGEIMRVVPTVKTFGKSRITTSVDMFDEEDRKIFEGLFSFCSYQRAGDKYVMTPHGLRT